MPKAVNGLRVCICTPDYVHLVRNGGIGTSFYHTAMELASRGADVTVLFASPTDHITAGELETGLAKLAKEPITFERLFSDSSREDFELFHPNDIFTVTSYLAYQWLKAREFDVIIFPDWRGVGYYSMFAKRQGLAFGDTSLWVQAHSTMLWHSLNNQATTYSEHDLRAFHLERKSIELCDVLTSPTQYLLDWMGEHGFIFPKETIVLPYIIGEQLAERRTEIKTIDEIVFYGRLEKRKGLHVFVQAIRRIRMFGESLIDFDRLKLTFLGKIDSIDDTNSIEYIKKALDGLDVTYRINPSLSSSEAIAYLKSRNALAVIPSVADNSPLTVHECMTHGIPFLAASSGGIPEIIHPDDHAAVLFPPNPVALAEKLESVVGRGAPTYARPSVDQTANRERWLTALTTLEPVGPGPRETPLVTICITHFERPKLLQKTLRGLAEQTYKDFEVIIVDDGSQSKAANSFLASLNSQFPSMKIKVERQLNRFVGAARNRALREATGEYIVFMDDDNYAHPNQLDYFVRAITTSEFDALTCVAVAFPEDQDPPELSSIVHLFLPLGCGLSVNLFSNCYGDANGIFRRSALEAVGGFTEDYGLSWEDYELLSKLEQAGFRVGVVPEPLMYLRHTTGSVSRRGSMVPNYYRALRPALATMPWSTYGDALLTALNPSLWMLNRISFGKDTSSDLDRRLLTHSDDPIGILRLMASNLASQNQAAKAYQQLEFHISSAKSLRILALDYVFSRLHLLGPSALQDDETIESVSAVAKAARNLLATLDLNELLAALGDGVDDAETSTEIVYLAGLQKMILGDATEAIRMWSTMLVEEENQYSKKNMDIEFGLETGDLLSPLYHYIKHGREEGRVFAFMRPLALPGATGPESTPSGYGDRLRALRTSSLPEAADIGRFLLSEVIAMGSIVAVADIARHIVKESERRYAASYPDVALALRADEYDSGYSHWVRFGHKETGREYLSAQLASDMFGERLKNYVDAVKYRKGPAGGVSISKLDKIHKLSNR